MTGNEYQQLALRTSNTELTPLGHLIEGTMGLCGEAGEAIEIVKKHYAHGHELDKKHLAIELGDVMWYLAETASAIGYDLDTIFQMNIDKLKRRYPDGFDEEHSINRAEGDI